MIIRPCLRPYPSFYNGIGKVKDSDIIKIGRLINKVPGIVFIIISAVLVHGLYYTNSCQIDWMSCGQMGVVIVGLLALEGVYLIRPWLKVREKIMAMAVDLKLLEKIPNLRRDMSLEEAAESVIATLSELQENASKTTEAMMALQQSQTDLLESLPEPVMVLDSELHILRANRSARALFPDLIISKNLISVFRDPELLAACDLAITDGAEDSLEFALTSPIERVFQARIKPLQHRGFSLAENRSALLLSLNDITTIKRTEQMRADFVANVSHEMRTPLASLIGFIETLLGPASKDAVAQKNFLQIMQTQAQNMSRLVEDLLSLSRIEMREHTQPSDMVDIEPILSTIAASLQMQVAQKNMMLQIECPAEFPPVRGDADEISQVFTNLITNAIRYGRPQTPIIVRAFVPEKNPPQFPSTDRAVAISVIDQGIGIPAQHIPRLTERFYRVDKARSREVGGTGLGLAIVKHIINRHRGGVSIESEENKGSKFTVYLPIYVDSGDQNESLGLA